MQFFIKADKWHEEELNGFYRHFLIVFIEDFWLFFSFIIFLKKPVQYLMLFSKIHVLYFYT